MRPNRNPHRTGGFSLVELMVAMALSLTLLAGVLAIFASSKKTYETTDRLSRIQESGRFALDTIVRDLRGAGYLSCRQGAPFFSALRTPNSLLWNFAIPVQGFDGQGSTWLPALDTGVAIGAVATSDALVVRVPRTDFPPLRLIEDMTSVEDPVLIEDVSPALIQENDIVQVADCGARSVFQVTQNAGGVLAHVDAAATKDAKEVVLAPGNATQEIDFAFTGGVLGSGELVPLRSVVYFLREGSTEGAGTSLWRRVGGSGVAEELVEGVESMQVEFGVDTDGNDVVGISEYQTADAVTNWNQVISVRIALLVRSLSAYGTDRDSGTYQVLGEEIADPGDRHLRQVFSTTVTIRNSAI